MVECTELYAIQSEWMYNTGWVNYSINNTGWVYTVVRLNPDSPIDTP